MYIVVVVISIAQVTTAFPSRNDPFSPLGPWSRRGPPCGLPSFINKLPTEAEKKVRAVWASYKDGEDCEKEHQATREIVHSLPEELRDSIFAGRCGPSFLRNVSKTVRNEFRNVWFDHRLSLELKEIALKKLAYSLLTGESLSLFNKWEEELQFRKAEYAEKVESLSPAAKDALEGWKAIRLQERAFLTSLPKTIREELKILCGRYRWRKMPEATTTEKPISVVITSASTETIVTANTAMEMAQSNTVMSLESGKSKEFPISLGVSFPALFAEEVECQAFY